MEKFTSIDQEIASKTYCVTGASGYIGSWLVNTLLQKGCNVHATVRDLGKVAYLSSKWKNEDRLKIFKANLQDEGGFDEAVKNCDGVFHVAASMEFHVDVQENIESYVKSKIIDPAINGALNVLKSCKRSKSVKRVVLTSSISTITAKDNDGNWKEMVDESCQVSTNHVWNAKACGWVYVLSKLATGEASFRFAKENKMELVSVISTTVGGPFITSDVPSSIRVLLSPVKGDPELHSILSTVNTRMGSIGIVHIQDICNAHIFLMEHPKAEGQYICCAQSCNLSQLVEILSQGYHCSKTIRITTTSEKDIPSVISSKKLKDLGFCYKHGLVTTLYETIKYCLECGYLPPTLSE